MAELNEKTSPPIAGKDAESALPLIHPKPQAVGDELRTAPHSETARSPHWTAIISSAPIIISVIALVISWQSLRTSEATLQLSQRAYIGVLRLDSHFEQKGVFLYLQNTGTLPADNIRIHIVESIVETKTMKTVSTAVSDLDLAHNLISKGSLYPIPIQLKDFELSEVRKLNSGEEQLLIGGTVKYSDGITSDERTLTFAYRLFPLANGDGVWMPYPVVSHAELMLRNP